MASISLCFNQIPLHKSVVVVIQEVVKLVENKRSGQCGTQASWHKVDQCWLANFEMVCTKESQG
jgi:hypothetical protein